MTWQGARRLVHRSTTSAETVRAGRYRLAGFEIDLSLLELRTTQGERVEISPLAFDLLVYLIEHRDRVVPKDELFETLWGDVAVMLPYLLFERHGDVEILRRQYESARAWVDLVDERAGVSHIWEADWQAGDVTDLQGGLQATAEQIDNELAAGGG